MYNYVSLKKLHIPVTCFHWSLFVNIYIVSFVVLPMCVCPSVRASIQSLQVSTYFIHLGLAWFGLWCLTPLSTYFSYIVVVSFIGGGNRSTWRQPPIYIYKNMCYRLKQIKIICIYSTGAQKNKRLY